MVALVAHCPVVGVNVYVDVPKVAVLIGDDHEPVIPLLDVVGNVGAVLF
jgi:hypothetical protein